MPDSANSDTPIPPSGEDQVIAALKDIASAIREHAAAVQELADATREGQPQEQDDGDGPGSLSDRG